MSTLSATHSANPSAAISREQAVKGTLSRFAINRGHRLLYAIAIDRDDAFLSGTHRSNLMGDNATKENDGLSSIKRHKSAQASSRVSNRRQRLANKFWIDD
jgi:hypothetical protein